MMALNDIAREAGVPAQCIEIIARWEGCLRKIAQNLYKAYLCPAGVPTIGRGTTWYNDRGVKVKLSDPPINLEECDRLLAYDIKVKYSPAVRRAVKPGRFQSENQYSACVSFAYNVGEHGFAKSTLCWLINQGRYQDAANEFNRWTRGGGRVLPGLVNRRRDERLLFLKPGAAYSGENQPLATPAKIGVPVLDAVPPKQQPKRGLIASLLFWRKI